MSMFDLCLAWNWEHDVDFASLLEGVCRARGLSLLQITPWNLDEMIDALVGGLIAFDALLDRASDDDERFIPAAEWARRQGILRINPYEHARRSWDKAAMHQALSGRLATPHTVVLPPYNQQPDLPPLDPAVVSALGECFTIKPAHGSGGRGVIPDCSIERVAAVRQEFPADKYLLQARVIPAWLDNRPAWFRVIYSAGRVFPFWWTVESHVYEPVTAEQAERLGLVVLDHMADAIAHICRLQLFSSEIALREDGCFVVVDYANDTIDLRLQSRTPEGVPDAIVAEIAHSLAGLVQNYQARSSRRELSFPVIG